MATLVEVSKPEYDLARSMQIDRSSDNIVYRVYEPDVPLTVLTSATTTSQPQNIVYSIRDLGEYFLLSDSYINIEGTFMKDDGTNLVATNNPALECASTSFFSQSRLRLNSQLVEDNSTLSHINAFMRQLTSLSPDYVMSCGTNTGFILDENTGYANDQEYVLGAGPSIEKQVAFNGGYRKRRLQAGAGEVKTTDGSDQLTGQILRSYCVRLSDLFSLATCRKVMKNVSLRVELTTRGQLEMIFSDDATSGTKFSISKMQLVIAVHNPSLDQLAQLESVMASGEDINYQYVKYTTFESDVATATTGSYRSFNFNTSAQKPIGAFLTTQRVNIAANEGLYNSMIFDNCNLTNVRLKINGKQYPYSEYEPNFGIGDRKSKNYARPYEELLRFMSKNYDINSGALLSSDQWAQLYPIYWIPFHNLPPSASYQLTAEVKVGGVFNSAASQTFPPLDGTRSVTQYKIYMTLLTVGEVVISGDRSGVVVRSN